MNSTVFIIPAADQTETTFTVNGEVYQKNWEWNTVAQLKTLAGMVGTSLDSRARKADIIRKLQFYVSWQSEEEAFRRWPILTQLEVPEEEINVLYNKIWRETMDEMPVEFIAFGQRALNFLKKRGDDFSRAEMLAERERDAPPAWTDKLLGSLVDDDSFEAPKEPHILVKVRYDEMDHDGYCSGADEEDAYVAKETVFFGALPTGDYDFSKKTWKGGISCSGGCGCCGVRQAYTLLSTQVVE